MSTPSRPGVSSYQTHRRLTSPQAALAIGRHHAQHRNHLLIIGVIVWAIGHVVPNALAARIGVGLAVIGAALILLGLLLPAIATGPTYALLR